MPEYWEYTTAVCCMGNWDEWLDLMHEALPGYENELKAEKELWALTNQFG